MKVPRAPCNWNSDAKVVATRSLPRSRASAELPSLFRHPVAAVLRLLHTIVSACIVCPASDSTEGGKKEEKEDAEARMAMIPLEFRRAEPRIEFLDAERSHRTINSLPQAEWKRNWLLESASSVERILE